MSKSWPIKTITLGRFLTSHFLSFKNLSLLFSHKTLQPYPLLFKQKQYQQISEVEHHELVFIWQIFRRVINSFSILKLKH